MTLLGLLDVRSQVSSQYFYTKTRNYRILFGSLREGAKTGLALGAATALYVLSEEGVRSVRNRLGFTRGVTLGSMADERSSDVRTTDVAPSTQTTADRGVGFEWLDGGIAGSILGAVISGFSESSFALQRRQR